MIFCKKNLLKKKFPKKILFMRKDIFQKYFHWKNNVQQKNFQKIFWKKILIKKDWQKKFCQKNFRKKNFARKKFWSWNLAFRIHLQNQHKLGQFLDGLVWFIYGLVLLVWFSSPIKLYWKEIQLTQNLASWNLACQLNSHQT